MRDSAPGEGLATNAMIRACRRPSPAVAAPTSPKARGDNCTARRIYAAHRAIAPGTTTAARGGVNPRTPRARSGAATFGRRRLPDLEDVPQAHENHGLGQPGMRRESIRDQNASLLVSLDRMGIGKQ